VLEFRILGPVQAVRGGHELELGGPGRRALLALLLVAAGRAALERGEAAVAANRYREGLGLWRGRALADVVDVEPLALAGARLEELRLVALEGRIEADIELGLAAEVTGELEGLVAEYRVRERLWRLLVLALYRSERQADALAGRPRGTSTTRRCCSPDAVLLRACATPARAPAKRRNRAGRRRSRWVRATGAPASAWPD
jgi:DNA-binding SARP family transcriptional activator